MSRILATDLQDGIGARFDAANNRIVVAEFAGVISSVDLAMGGGRTVLGSGYMELEDLVLTNNGAIAYVTERGGDILKVDLHAADRTSASIVTSGLMEPHQLILFEADGIAWVIENNILERLLEIDLATGGQKVLASGFEHATGLVARIDRSLALVSEQTAADGRITAVQIPSGARMVIADGLTNPFFLHWLDASESAIMFTERDPTNRVSIVEIQGSNHERHLALLGASFRPSSALLVASEMIICADSTVVAYDITGGYPKQVFIEVPHDGLYVGSYRHVPVKVGSSGVAFNDLDFKVIGGRSAGAISESHDFTYDPANPDIMLLAGYRPGIYLLQAIHRPTGAIAGHQTY